jgi:hypothetical protein
MTQDMAVQIASRIAAGDTQRAIAADFGCHESNISHLKKSNAFIRPIIDNIHSKLISRSSSIAAFNIHKNIVDYLKLKPGEDDQRRDHGYKASVKLLEAIGILPSQSPSILIQQIFQTTNNITLSDTIASQLGDVVDVLPNDPLEVIDGK